MPQMMPQTCPRLCPRHVPDDAPDIPLSITFDILKALFRDISHDRSFQHCTWVYLALPDCTRLYLAVPDSALVCHDLPFHRLPHTATDWLKCFRIYRTSVYIQNFFEFRLRIYGATGRVEATKNMGKWGFPWKKIVASTHPVAPYIPRRNLKKVVLWNTLIYRLKCSKAISG